MEPKIVTRESFNVVGMQHIGNNQNGEFSKLWEQFIPRMGEITNAVNKGVFYGYCSCQCEGDCKCGAGADFMYSACQQVESLDAIPEGMVGKTIPASKYAVFTHRGPLSGLPKTFEDVYSEWLPAAGLETSLNFGLELYDERFNPCSEESELDIYIPVK